ncbi:hypothetical protein [Candidatus Rariloculus sp.]|uniref:hypothetical protein n=1 Tax=Candidatus Rariloculus sp. TaxID=3101265 RepID=UPI003D146C0A
MDLIPDTAPHWHILLTHFPSVGTVFGLGLFLASFYMKSEDLRRASLVIFVLMGLLVIPTYISGAATRWAIGNDPDVSLDLIAVHQDMALFAFIFVALTGCLSWFALWQYRRFSKPHPWNLIAILVLSVIAVFGLTQTGNLGGDINHAEIRSAEDVAAAAGQEGQGITAAIEESIISGAWAWPAMEAAHFMGMAVLFGVVIIITLRTLGVAKMIPFTAVHRLLPLGILGFFVNSVTGMLFFIADSGRYTAMTNSFYPKISLIMIGGVCLLYFTIFNRPWNLKQGDDGPVQAKVVAALTIALWGGVIIYGRLLPYLEGG